MRTRRDWMPIGMLFAGTSFCLLMYGCFSFITNPATRSKDAYPLQLMEAQEADATAYVKARWTFSEYAVRNMPAEMASGTWSSSTNLWNCNVERFECIEVDFEIPAHQVKAAWLVSYDKGTVHQFGVRPLTDAVGTLFEPAAPTQDDVDKVAQALAVDAKNQPSSVDGQFTSLIQGSYEINPDVLVPHTGYPLPAGGTWTESTHVAEIPDPSVCHSGEFVCTDVAYTDPTYGIKCRWTVAVPPADPASQRVYSNETARSYFRKHPD